MVSVGKYIRCGGESIISYVIIVEENLFWTGDLTRDTWVEEISSWLFLWVFSTCSGKSMYTIRFELVSSLLLEFIYA